MRKSALLAASAVVALSFAAAGSAFAASGAAASGAAAADTTPSLVSPHYGKWGFDPAAIDRSVKPGDDFFQFANGNALKTMEIPSDRTRYGNFDVLSVLSENRVHSILEAAAASPKDAREAKIGAYYKAYMDEARIEALGDAPLQKDLQRVRDAKTHSDIVAIMGDVHGEFYASLFGGGVGPDGKDPTKYAFQMRSGGLGLGDRDFYLKDTPRNKEIRAKYVPYIEQMLTLAKWPNPHDAALAVMAFETKMAEASWTREMSRDRDKTYNPMSTAELAAYAPGFDWPRYFTTLEVPGLNRVILGDNTAFKAKAKIFAGTPVETLKAWEAFQTADAAAPLLSKAFVDARFEFRNKTLGGQPEQGPRWKRAVAATDGALGEAVGASYVEKYFPPEAKAQMLELVGNIKVALRHRIENLEWMSPDTKKKAVEKLDHFSVKIAYPEKFRDFSKLEVSPTDLYGDVKRSRYFEWQRRVVRYHQPVDRTDWNMAPQVVNANYNPPFNEILFPAAILQPPFFDPKADPAVNYGGIGGVIGHEISHGFDDQGRKSDGYGRLTDWWTAEDAGKFKERTDRLDKQYSANVPLASHPEEHIVGATTMGENIGDMGGINLALDAYHASLKGKPAPVLDGLTGDQRVFLGWAQVWRSKIRDNALLQQIHTDPHSPSTARVNEVVRNVDSWYTAFDVKPGDKLYLSPTERTHIW